jgi:CheY-like chemotaxis protein
MSATIDTGPSTGALAPEARPIVLVVDDERFSRTVVARKIASMGATVVEAEDGIQALHCLQAANVDLVIVDLEMPRMDGWDLIGCVRGHPKVRHVPVIVLTGNESRSALERALSAGATSFLLKPLNWTAFGAHIRHMLHLSWQAGCYRNKAASGS